MHSLCYIKTFLLWSIPLSPYSRTLRSNCVYLVTTAGFTGVVIPRSVHLINMFVIHMISQINTKENTGPYCKSTNFGVLLNLANCVSSLIFVATNMYVDRTLHRRAAGETPNLIAAKLPPNQFILRNAKFYSRQNLLIYSMLFSIMYSTACRLSSMIAVGILI